ncbi:MmcQ/YjbR family DNA-binding protein [Pseudoduganella sp.]|uniref:MmcQ/YjbR family DNA-binding protein n=1 Tax=Pseudoduganella sp. TaxID=1880898 RepID=UPI0035B44D26
MDISQLKARCASLPGAESLLHAPPVNVLSYKIGGKTFAYFKTSEPEQWRFSFRTTPDRFLELTGMPGVKPARYMGRFHWVTIVDVSRFQEDYLVELVQWSYDKAFSSLPKARQRELRATLQPVSA